MRYFFIGTAILLIMIAAGILYPLPDPKARCGVESFAWTEPGLVARSAQPSIASLACLCYAKFAAVVNLRQESLGYNEATVVKTLGMKYWLLPIVNDTAPSPKQVSEYMTFINDHRQRCAPVLTHDAAGRGRMGVMDGIYLLWKGWTTREVFARYIEFGAKIDCEKGGNGQIQLLHEIGLLLGRGDAWPVGTDHYGNSWKNCPRPGYVAKWDYSTIEFPPYVASNCQS